MGRNVPCVVLGFLVAICAGCGGGSGSANIVPPPPPPPPADFSLNLSTSALSVTQGGPSAPVSVSVGGVNGFSGAVQVTLTGLPSGVTSNPTSPFSVAAGSAVSVIFDVAANVATGNISVVAEGSSGALTHSKNLALTVESGTTQNLPRTGFAETDEVAALDNPPGEVRHRRIAYDPASKQIFVANRAMNRVEVFSSTDQSRKGQVSVPGATSVDLSADGSTVWVGTALEQIAAIDVASLQVKARYAVSGLTPLPNVFFDRPTEVLALSNGKAMVRLRQPAAAESLLAVWDAAANTWTSLVPSAPQLFQNGAGAMARSGNHTKVLVAANDASGEVALFDSNGAVVAGPQSLGGGTISLAAANLDGSQYAVALKSGGTTQVLLLSTGLNAVASYLAGDPSGLTFARDGASLFVAEAPVTGHVITVLNGHNLQFLGQVADAAIEAESSQVEEVDETQLIFGVANHGVSFVDAAKPGTQLSTAATFSALPIAQPAEGPGAGGTATSITGQNFVNGAQVKFGTQVAANVTVTGGTQIQVSTPSNAAAGPVNVTAYFPDGRLAIAPEAFSYGPQVVEIFPNGGRKSGGETIQIYGYGFGNDAGQVSVKIGGQSATIQKVENIAAIAASLGLPADYPFPVERITVVTPAGTAGKADVTITSAAGMATAGKGFQFLETVTLFTKPGLYKFVQYDPKRQWIYMGTTDHVDVFDLSGQTFRSGLQPPGGPPPDAAIRGLSLTPDGSQLVIADFGAQSVYLLNPDSGAGTTVAVGGVPGFLNSGPARVAATSTQKVFVALSGEGGGSNACSNCLGQMDIQASPPVIQPAPQPEISFLTGTPLVQSDASGDHVYLAFGGAPGGPLATWDAASPNQFTTSSANDSTSDLTAAADGTMFASRANGASEIRAMDLTLIGSPASPDLQRVSGRVAVPGLAVHPSGALLYEPFLTGPAPAAPPAVGVQGGIDIVDARTGQLRMRIFLPEAFAMLASDTDGLHGQFLTVDENGQRLFALTTSGLTVIQLANVPLSIGTVLPATGPAAGGETVVIRGSGFQSGMTATLGGKPAAVFFKDMNTINLTTPALGAGAQQLALKNPDGASWSLDAAYVSN